MRPNIKRRCGSDSREGPHRRASQVLEDRQSSAGSQLAARLARADLKLAVAWANISRGQDQNDPGEADCGRGRGSSATRDRYVNTASLGHATMILTTYLARGDLCLRERGWREGGQGGRTRGVNCENSEAVRGNPCCVITYFDVSGWAAAGLDLGGGERDARGRGGLGRGCTHTHTLVVTGAAVAGLSVTSRCFSATFVSMAFNSIFMGFFSTPQLDKYSRCSVPERPSPSAMYATPALVSALFDMSRFVRQRLYWPVREGGRSWGAWIFASGASRRANPHLSSMVAKGVGRGLVCLDVRAHRAFPGGPTCLRCTSHGTRSCCESRPRPFPRRCCPICPGSVGEQERRRVGVVVVAQFV